MFCLSSSNFRKSLIIEVVSDILLPAPLAQTKTGGLLTPHPYTEQTIKKCNFWWV